MKTFTIRKNREFSANSRIFVRCGDSPVLISGFDPVRITIAEGQSFRVTFLWVGSRKIKYYQIPDNASYIVKPRLKERLAYIVVFLLIAFIVCFLNTGSRWSILPIFPFWGYIFLYLTVLKNRYLVIREENGDKK